MVARTSIRRKTVVGNSGAMNVLEISTLWVLVVYVKYTNVCVEFSVRTDDAGGLPPTVTVQSPNDVQFMKGFGMLTLQ